MPARLDLAGSLQAEGLILAERESKIWDNMGEPRPIGAIEASNGGGGI